LSFRLIYVLVSFMPGTAPPAADRFARIIDDLCRAVAAHIARDRTAGPLIVLIWSYLRRKAARFAALAARVRTGTLPAAPAARRRAARPASSRPRQRLPEGFAWLVRLVPEAACLGSQLQHLLTDPEMAALVSAAPGMARILRPLCRMLAVAPAPGLLPPPPGKPVSPAHTAAPGRATPGRLPTGMLPPDTQTVATAPPPWRPPRRQARTAPVLVARPPVPA
jgi:hypothetical protein